jgi:hypothetical protein
MRSPLRVPTTVRPMSRPKQFEEHRWVGDKRNQRVHDLDNPTDACAIAELMGAETYVSFGPDTLTEARNRSYRPCRHCVPDAGAVLDAETSAA